MAEKMDGEPVKNGKKPAAAGAGDGRSGSVHAPEGRRADADGNRVYNKIQKIIENFDAIKKRYNL